MLRSVAALVALLSTASGLPVKVRSPSNATHCYTNKTAVALGGVDFVDLATKAATAVPSIGSSDFSATLSGYTFHFLNAANRDAFNADPWTFAPAYGGFCAWGVGGEADPGQKSPWLPPVTIDPTGADKDINWLRWQNRTFYFLMPQPLSRMDQDMPKYTKIADENWALWFGTDKSKWPFNTMCWSGNGPDSLDARGPIGTI